MRPSSCARPPRPQSAGIPRERWVFPLAGADADDHWFLSHRLDFHSSPAIRLAGGSALSLAGAGIDDVAHLDLYSCFPSAVEIAAAELGLADDDPSRPLTVTGGLTFGGGPGNNYGTHAVASMIDALRADPGSLGLVTGVGWYLTKHSIGRLRDRAPGLPTGPGRDRGESTGTTGTATPAGLPEGTETEQAGGFAWASPAARRRRPPAVLTGRRCRGRGHRRDLLRLLRAGRRARRRRGGLPHPGRASGLGQRHRSRPAWPCWSPKRGAAGSAPSGPMARSTWADRVEAGADPARR